MNNIKDADFLATFPPALKLDKKMLALGKLIAEELHITANEAEKNVIYANIDNLAEKWLDVLAYDLHVDWYDYDYPVEAKRAIIKDSVRVHQKLGTKAAVERALGGIHPQSEIEEWFNYGGQAYHFRIVLDTTKSRVAADYDEIVRTVDIYKRLTAHLDGLYYQCSISVVVMPKTEYFIFSAPMTGKTKTGTKPYRNRAGAVTKATIKVKSTAAGYIAESIRTGTKPDRSTIFLKDSKSIVTDSDTNKYIFESNMTGEEKAGTTPYVATVGGTAEKAVKATVKGQAYKFDTDMTGTKPDRNKAFLSHEVAAVGETDLEAFLYENAFTGTIPGRNTEFGVQEKGITQTAKAESYGYEVKRCGSNRLSK